MTLTPLRTRGYGLPLPVLRTLRRTAPLALALLLACAKAADLPSGPTSVLHYPAWIDTLPGATPSDGMLLVVNLDQDLAFDGGAVVAIAGDPDLTSTTIQGGSISGGVSVPNMAGQMLVVHGSDDPVLTGAGTNCRHKTDGTPGLYDGDADPTRNYTPPFALVAGRFEDTLVKVDLGSAGQAPFRATRAIGLHPFSASSPFGVGLSCSADGHPRAWIGWQAGQESAGYVSQVDLAVAPGTPGSVVQVYVGAGEPRSFAYDAGTDRLYFTNREFFEASPVRWINVGDGCGDFDNGVQDERRGGCHVDGGFDLSRQIRGAEPNEIALNSEESRPVSACTSAPGLGTCRRAYLSVRMYDADLAAATGSRPGSDVGGKLIVLELPESGLGRPEPHVVADFDIGVMAGPLKVIPRPGKRDLIAVAAVDDSLLWLYDDDIGAMVKVFGRDASGLPVLGHGIAGITSMVLAGATVPTVRLFVTSYADNWVSAVDVPLDKPENAFVVRDPKNNTRYLRLGDTP